MAKDPLSLAKAVCDTMIAKFAPAELPPAGRFHYHQGVFLSGMRMYADIAKERKYSDYVKAWVDSIIKDEGDFNYHKDQMDDVQPGILLFDLLKETGDRKYKAALDRLLATYDTWHKTAGGAFWHKENLPGQVWLDGIYMEGPLQMRYGAEFGDPSRFEKVILHLEQVIVHTKDSKTGLLYHAWDETGKSPWANPKTGCSPEFWGRSVGWVVAAIVDILDILPANHPKRPELIGFLDGLVEALGKVQDPRTGMWFQVLDKGDRPDDWLEHSCSCLFVYAIAKGVRMGYLGKGRLDIARRGFEGIAAMVKVDADGKASIPEICIGTGVGDYAHYIARPRSVNDLHGAGAFLFACAEASKFPGKA
jgi:unsaturated rhamnogalacturonyl hydrolase